MSTIPDQVMDAIHFADFVMAKEKEDRIDSSAAVVYDRIALLTALAAQAFRDSLNVLDADIELRQHLQRLVSLFERPLIGPGVLDLGQQPRAVPFRSQFPRARS